MEQIQIHQLSLGEFRDLLTEIFSAHLNKAGKKPDEQLITRKELAKRLGISYPTIQKYSELGILEPRKLGGRIFFLWSEIIDAAIKVEPSQPINNHK